ncbi:MAG: hypothetical protein IPF54_07475, partial [Draconibacterium sp.]|nr:hypothetical protein [Draconibacterium sp.]
MVNPKNAPLLVINYTLSAVPTIILSGIPLNNFSSQPGTPSAEQNYTVSGINLTEDIVITAPTDFEISTSGGSGFGSTLTLVQTGGSVAETPVYVRMNSSEVGSLSGNISHNSSGVSEKNVAVNGTVT